ncbi:hypothetical protein J6590_035999 [Homalodisca vitripennis]|nr:hypothetical protein J6590_035999 [Homalodisca vitripennis]
MDDGTSCRDLVIICLMSACPISRAVLSFGGPRKGNWLGPVIFPTTLFVDAVYPNKRVAQAYLGSGKILRKTAPSSKQPALDLRSLGTPNHYKLPGSFLKNQPVTWISRSLRTHNHSKATNTRYSPSSESTRHLELPDLTVSRNSQPLQAPRLLPLKSTRTHNHSKLPTPVIVIHLTKLVTWISRSLRTHNHSKLPTPAIVLHLNQPNIWISWSLGTHNHSNLATPVIVLQLNQPDTWRSRSLGTPNYYKLPGSFL